MTDLEAALAAGGKIGETDLDRALAAGGKVAPAIDAGPEARRAIFGGPKFPEPKSDEELGLDEGPKFYRGVPRFLFADRKAGGVDTSGVSGNFVERAQDAPGTEAYASHHVGDEMNDTGAQLITGGALAAPLAAASPALVAPGVAGAQQAAFQGQNPAVGFALGMAPGAANLAAKGLGAADRAIGEAAFNRATTAGFGEGPGLIARAAGKLTGMAAGSTHGPLGLLVGHDLGGRAASLFSKAGDAATNALARRWLDQEIVGATVPDLVRLPTTEVAPLPGSVPGSPLATPRATGYSPSAPPIPARTPLAPLTPTGPTLPTSVPPGALGTPFLDEISGEPVTVAGRGGFLPEEAPTNAGAKPRRLQIQDENGNDLVGPDAKPSLREDVARDAQAFRRSPIEENPGEPPAPLESQLERSVRMLSELKSAARAGKVSTAMIQEALQAGMSPQAVAKTVGREAFERATQ